MCVFFTPSWLMPASFDDQLYGSVFGKYPTEQRLLIQDLEAQSVEMTSWVQSWQKPPPTLLIVGRQDPIFSVEDVRKLSDITDGRVKVYGFADHVPQVEHSRRFYRNTRRFLNQYAAPPKVGTDLEE
jgi:pimeloyl-ACP methyl ester carboxylesterase